MALCLKSITLKHVGKVSMLNEKIILQEIKNCKFAKEIEKNIFEIHDEIEKKKIIKFE